MSENQQQKTEPPTPKRLRDARKKGQVARSNDVCSTALTIVIFVYLGLAWGFHLNGIVDHLDQVRRLSLLPFEEALRPAMMGVGYKLMRTLFPFLAMIVFVGIFSNFVQVGALLSFEPIIPKLEKLHPMKKLKQIFSLKNFIEFIKSALKITALGLLIFYIVRGLIGTILQLPNEGFLGVMLILPIILKQFAFYISIVYILIASADYFFQKWNHIKQLRMSKDEIKREYKEMEGSPEIKGKRRQLHRELANQETAQKTRKSSVLVTNPTHYAVALYYEKEKTKLPVVMAKGEGYMALHMMKIAKEANIPVMRNVPLAHSLYEQVQVDQYIPSDLIEAVAEVLRWVQEVNH